MCLVANEGPFSHKPVRSPFAFFPNNNINNSTIAEHDQQGLNPLWPVRDRALCGILI